MMDVPFSEHSISVSICKNPTADQRDGLYLVQAFNSVGWFTWAERTFFQTPYYPGKIRIAACIPASIELSDGQIVVFNVTLSGKTPCSWHGDEVWRGAVYLPSHMTKTAKAEKLFFAQLSGQTEIYPFSPTTDTIKLVPSKHAPIMQWLGESNFTGKEWHIRANATHAKSRTYRDA